MNLPADAAQDQSNCPPDYYRKSNGMLHQLPENDVETASNAITDAQLARLDAMSREELVALVKRVSGAMWGIALMTPEETKAALKLKIAYIAMTSKDNATVLKACNDWLDREEGKAIQRIDQRTQNIPSGGTSDLSTAQLIALISQAQAGNLLPPGVKLLDNGMIDVTPTKDQ